MARTVARGKALVAQLRARADVRDADALAAYLGRFKMARKAGKSVAEATKAAKGIASKPGKGSDDRAQAKAPKPAQADTPGADLDADDPFDDPFSEDFGDDEAAETPEERERRQYEAQLMRELERTERSDLSTAILDAGGIQTRDDLREEYREIPNHFKRKDGMPGDEMAEYLSVYYPELGIESENDLLQFFANR